MSNLIEVAPIKGAASRQAELDQAYADIETFAEGMERESELKLQFINERDELQKNFDNALKTIEVQQRFLDDADGANEFLTSKNDELQKRIDEALSQIELKQNEYWKNWKKSADMMDQGASNAYEVAYWILKGKKDE